MEFIKPVGAIVFAKVNVEGPENVCLSNFKTAINKFKSDILDIAIKPIFFFFTNNNKMVVGKIIINGTTNWITGFLTVSSNGRDSGPKKTKYKLMNIVKEYSETRK